MAIVLVSATALAAADRAADLVVTALALDPAGPVVMALAPDPAALAAMIIAEMTAALPALKTHRSSVRSSPAPSSPMT
jgi:hypothetical protein